MSNHYLRAVYSNFWKSKVRFIKVEEADFSSGMYEAELFATLGSLVFTLVVVVNCSLVTPLIVREMVLLFFHLAHSRYCIDFVLQSIYSETDVSLHGGVDVRCKVPTGIYKVILILFQIL